MGKSVWGSPVELWGIKDTPKGYKVIAQMLIERYMENRPIARSESGGYYTYHSTGVWIETDDIKIRKRLLKIVNYFVPYLWKSSTSANVVSFLPLLCPNFNGLQSANNFINVENGLLDLQTFFIFYSDGSYGKSVLCSILHHLAGGDKNVSSVTLSNLNQKFQRAELFGKIVNISTENEASKFNTEALKSITSGDPIQIEHKFQKPFTTRLTAKLLFAMNRLPEPQDKTFAFYRRMILVPFKTKFVDNPHEGTNEMRRNPQIEEELLEELPGIFAWCIEGLKRLVENRYQFTRSREAEKLMVEYRKDTSPVFSFIEECVLDNSNSTSGENACISTQELFETYNYWRIKNGMKGSFDKRNFLKNLRKGLREFNIHFTESHSGILRYFDGICLTEQYQRNLDDLYEFDDFEDEDDNELEDEE